MKKLKKIGFICLAVIVGLILFRNVLIKNAVTIGASQVMGAKVTLDSFKMGIFKQSVRIKGFKIYNPKGFPKEILIDIPEVSVDYSLPDLLGGKIHLPLLVVNLKEMSVVKNKEGLLNVNALKVAQKDDEAPKEDKKEKKKSKKKSKPLKMQIDEMKLVVGQVVYKDFTKGDPKIEVTDVGIDKTFKNISSAQELASIVMVQAMGATAIQGVKVYAAAALLGPAGIAGAVLVGKDDSVETYNVSYDKAFSVALEVIEGKTKSQDSSKGEIKAKVDGADVTIKVVSLEENKTEVTVSARKYMLPKPKIASGVLYQITEKLGK